MAARSGAACPRQAAIPYEIVCVRGALNDGKSSQFGMRYSGIIRPCHRSSMTWRISAHVADRHQAAAAVDVEAGGQPVAVAGTSSPPSAAPSGLVRWCAAITHAIQPIISASRLLPLQREFSIPSDQSKAPLIGLCALQPMSKK